MGKNDRGPSAGINQRLGALERELIGLEDMLENDEAWRALALEAKRALDRPGKASTLSRLKKALERNPIYQARTKLLEAMSLLSEPSPQRSGQAGAQPPPLPSDWPPPLPSEPPPLPASANRYAPPMDVDEAEVVIVKRDSPLPALDEEAAAEAEISPPSERSLRRRLADAREPKGFDGEAYAAYSDAIEEASVVIVSAEEIALREAEAAAAAAATPRRRRPTIIKRD